MNFKSRFGISLGLAGALCYFLSLFGGYVASALLVGAILLIEDNQWLRKTALSALLMLVCFSVLSTFLSLLPSLFVIMNNLAMVFDAYLDFSVFQNLISAVSGLLNIAKQAVFILFGILALNQSTLPAFPANSLFAKYL